MLVQTSRTVKFVYKPICREVHFGELTAPVSRRKSNQGTSVNKCPRFFYERSTGPIMQLNTGRTCLIVEFSSYGTANINIFLKSSVLFQGPYANFAYNKAIVWINNSISHRKKSTWLARSSQVFEFLNNWIAQSACLRRKAGLSYLSPPLCCSASMVEARFLRITAGIASSAA